MYSINNGGLEVSPHDPQCLVIPEQAEHGYSVQQLQHLPGTVACPLLWVFCFALAGHGLDGLRLGEARVECPELTHGLVSDGTRTCDIFSSTNLNTSIRE